MSPALLSLLTFVALVLAVLSLGSLVSDLFRKNKSRVSRRLDDEFHRRQREQVRKSSVFKDLQKVSAGPLDDPAAPELTLAARLERMIEQSGLELTPGRLLAYKMAAGPGPGLLAGLLLGSPLIAILLGLFGAPLPLLYVEFKRRGRLEVLRAQLPEAYDLMARGLRAGQTVSQTMQGVADEFPQPIAGEFSYCYEQQNLGLSTEVALRDLSRRTGLMEVNIFAVAVVVQRQVGGNLAEMLEQLAHLVRERFRIRGAIRTLTAEGRLQALVLMGLPPAMFLAMLVINPSYARILFDYPLLLIGVLVSMGFGALWIRKIINFDF